MTIRAQGGGDIPRASQRPRARPWLGAGYLTLAQLTAVTEQQLLQLHAIGPNAISQLRSALAERGLTLAHPPPAPG